MKDGRELDFALPSPRLLILATTGSHSVPQEEWKLLSANLLGCAFEGLLPSVSSGVFSCLQFADSTVKRKNFCTQRVSSLWNVLLQDLAWMPLK